MPQSISDEVGVIAEALAACLPGQAVAIGPARLRRVLDTMRAMGEALNEASRGDRHAAYCNAIQGPDNETWIENDRCDCWLKAARAALALYEGTK